MSKVKNFIRWFKDFSSLGDAALESAVVGVFDRAERAEVYKELDQNPEIDLHDMVCCITYADHCTTPLLARIAELEAALTEARSWIGDGEDSICSFAYPKECSSDYVEMVNRVDAVLGKGDAS